MAALGLRVRFWIESILATVTALLSTIFLPPSPLASPAGLDRAVAVDVVLALAAISWSTSRSTGLAPR